MGLEALDDTGQAQLLAGDPIPAAPSKNPDISTIIVPGSSTSAVSLNVAFAWIAILALAINLV